MRTFTRRLSRTGMVCIVACWGMSVLAQSVDPSQTPIPDVQEILADPRRALVLEARIGAGTAQRIDAYISDTPPGAHVGDPAHLHIRWFDALGNRIGGRNAWDPRWEFQRDGNDERRVILPEAVGVFPIPFSRSIALVSITEIETGLVLLETDVRNVVQSFCLAFPEDPNCTGGTDSDGDGVDDGVDNCPAVANPGQEDTDGDGLGDACSPDTGNDADGDGIDDDADNCPAQPNVGQQDFDGDGAGDACDTDADGDTVNNGRDICPRTTVPEHAPTSGSLGTNRWALRRADGLFTQAPPQAGSVHSFTATDTDGCSCEQIVAATSAGGAHLRVGCSTGVILDWIGRD